ncbi:MAG: SPBc2 prophage-derived endonuclease YokF precursor [Verrucomicrobia bacterium ADurb.Bin345]|nr:MAG: SPBc2 prophage-derived endonuclease YokF precursor [Verrucomicrobia bacterium ADurb.Bin345]
MSREGSGHFTRIVVTAALCGAAFYGGYRYHHWKVYDQAEYLVQVVNVVDGDTLDIDWFRGVARLRIVGIDTFESRHGAKLKSQAEEWGVTDGRAADLGRLATEAVQTAVTGKLVRIKFPSGSIERDSFGRLLAYVYVDGVDLGLHLMANGLAYPRPEAHVRDKYYEWPLLQARNYRKGMFADEGRAR